MKTGIIHNEQICTPIQASELFKGINFGELIERKVKIKLVWAAGVGVRNGSGVRATCAGKLVPMGDSYVLPCASYEVAIDRTNRTNWEAVPSNGYPTDLLDNAHKPEAMAFDIISDSSHSGGMDYLARKIIPAAAHRGYFRPVHQWTPQFLYASNTDGSGEGCGISRKPVFRIDANGLSLDAPLAIRLGIFDEAKIRELENYRS